MLDYDSSVSSVCIELTRSFSANTQSSMVSGPRFNLSLNILNACSLTWLRVMPGVKGLGCWGCCSFSFIILDKI